MGHEKSKAEQLEALRRWTEQTAWKWNKGLEESQQLRDVLVTMGETYEEAIGEDFELFTKEEADGTGFFLTYFIGPEDSERHAIGPVRFSYVPGLTDEQQREYAKAVKARREESKGG